MRNVRGLQGKFSLFINLKYYERNFQFVALYVWEVSSSTPKKTPQTKQILARFLEEYLRMSIQFYKKDIL